MIELIEGPPEQVVGLEAVGEVSSDASEKAASRLPGGSCNEQEVRPLPMLVKHHLILHVNPVPGGAALEVTT